eukprot:s2142_g9.t1
MPTQDPKCYATSIYIDLHACLHSQTERANAHLATVLPRAQVGPSRGNKTFLRRPGAISKAWEVVIQFSLPKVGRNKLGNQTFKNGTLHLWNHRPVSLVSARARSKIGKG